MTAKCIGGVFIANQANALSLTETAPPIILATQLLLILRTEKKLNICSIQELGALADIFNGEVTKMPIEDNLKSILSRYMLYIVPPPVFVVYMLSMH